MKIVEQLSLLLENQPGTLADVCDALAVARINIYGLSVADASDHAVVRMVVSDPRKALHIFEAYGTLAIESEVLMIENDNRPGALSAITKALAEKKINIEYAYLASQPTAKKGLLIMRVGDPKKALRVLRALTPVAAPAAPRG